MHDTFYTIIAPKKLYSNSSYYFALTLYNPCPKQCKLCIVNVSIRDEIGDCYITDTFTVAVNTTEFCMLPIGNVPDNGKFQLIVESVLGIRFRHQASLELQHKNSLIVIQCDKEVYREGDCLKFKVLILDYKFYPGKIENDTLKIELLDSNRNIMRAWNNIQASNGVFQNEFVLPDKSDLGRWTIIAKWDGQERHKYIDVIKNISKDFNVTIESQSHVSMKNYIVECSVHASYLHQQHQQTQQLPLFNGNAIAYLYRREHVTHSANISDYKQAPIAQKTTKIEGNCSFLFDVGYGECENNEVVHGGNYEVKVVVTDVTTGLSHDARQIINAHRNPYNITCNLKRSKIRRGVSINYTIFVLNHDGSPIEVNDDVERTITVVREQFSKNHKENVITQEDRYLNDCGEVNVTLSTLPDETNFSLKIIYQEQETFVGYYDINDDDDWIVVNELCSSGDQEIFLEISSSRELCDLSYFFMFGAELRSLVPTFSCRKFDNSIVLTFLKPPDLPPLSHFVIYFIKTNKLFSRVVPFDAKTIFRNTVEIELSSTFVGPNEPVDIKISSQPNSYVGLISLDAAKVSNDFGSGHIDILRQLFDYSAIADLVTSTDTNLILFTNTTNKSGQPLKHLLLRDQEYYQVAERPSTVSVALPDNWLWHSFTDNNSEGEWSLRKATPHISTTWVIFGFSLHSATGFAVTSQPRFLRVGSS